MESVFLPGLAPQKQDVGGLPDEELFPPNPLHIIAALRRTISIEVSRMARSWVPHPFRSLFAKRVGYLRTSASSCVPCLPPSARSKNKKSRVFATFFRRSLV